MLEISFDVCGFGTAAAAVAVGGASLQAHRVMMRLRAHSERLFAVCFCCTYCCAALRRYVRHSGRSVSCRPC